MFLCLNVLVLTFLNLQWWFSCVSSLKIKVSSKKYIQTFTAYSSKIGNQADQIMEQYWLWQYFNKPMRKVGNCSSSLDSFLIQLYWDWKKSFSDGSLVCIILLATSSLYYKKVELQQWLWTRDESSILGLAKISLMWELVLGILC